MEQRGTGSETESGASSRSGSTSRKRERSKTPPSDIKKFKKPQLKDTKSKNLKKTRATPVNPDGQSKITSYRDKSKTSVTTTNMADGENLSAFEKLVLKKLQDLTTKVDNMDRKLDDRINHLEGRVHVVEQAQDTLTSKIDDLKRQQTAGEELIMSSDMRATLSYDQSSANEQFLRNFNLRIYNVPENEKETVKECETKVLELFKDTLDVTVPLESIDLIHRVGKKQNTSNRLTEKENPNNQMPASEKQSLNESQNESTEPKNTNGEKSESSQCENVKETEQKIDSPTGRPIIVSFLSRRLRRDVLEKRAILKKKSSSKTPIMIVEDLSKVNYTLLKKARDMDKYEKAWSRDGTIYAKQSINGLIVPIKSFQDLMSPPLMRTNAADDTQIQHSRPLFHTRGRGGSYRGQRGRKGYGHARDRYYQGYDPNFGYAHAYERGHQGYDPKFGYGGPGPSGSGIATQNRFDGLQNNIIDDDMKSQEDGQISDKNSGPD